MPAAIGHLQGPALKEKPSPKRHKAGLVGPAVLVVELVRAVLFRPPTQNVWKIAFSLWLLALG
jgi:hypothetical protein